VDVASGAGFRAENAEIAAGEFDFLKETGTGEDAELAEAGHDAYADDVEGIVVVRAAGGSFDHVALVALVAVVAADNDGAADGGSGDDGPVVQTGDGAEFDADPGVGADADADVGTDADADAGIAEIGHARAAAHRERTATHSYGRIFQTRRQWPNVATARTHSAHAGHWNDSALFQNCKQPDFAAAPAKKQRRRYHAATHS
jgi:hypothetical protein